MTDRWRNPLSEKLFQTIAQLNTTDEVANFLRDLLTESELEEFSLRWQVAQALFKGKPQRQVAQETGASIATVTRVNQWLRRGMGGYLRAIERQSKASDKTSHQHTPARLVATS